jgi:hypothetical protein
MVASRFRCARLFVVGLVVFLECGLAFALDVTAAGFAFAGNYADAEKRFPYTFKMLKRIEANKEQNLSLFINNRLKNVKNPNYDFKFGELVNLKNSSQALMTVLMLTGETVATENYGSYHKTFVSLRGDALIFDYKSQTIVRSYPLSVVLFDATHEKPSEERISGFVADLIRRDDGRGLVTQYLRRLESATPASETAKTVQVRKAEVMPEALNLFPESMRNNKIAVDSLLADAVGSIFSAKLGISMLPNSIGHAVGGVMTMRLENGDDFKLKLGDGDYVFDVTLNKFAKIKTSENNVGVAYVYGAYASLTFQEPMLSTIYISTDLKNGETSIVPAGQVTNDDFAAYQDAIRGMFLKLSEAIEKPGSKWLKTAASAKDIDAQLDITREIIRKCK